MKNAAFKSSFFLLITLLTVLSLQAKPHDYFIKFTDRNNTIYSIDKPEQFLSPRALLRRQKQNIYIDSTDLPVNSWYLDSLRRTGAKVLFASKWFNAATVEITDTTGVVMQRIISLPFVDTKDTQRLRKMGGKIKSTGTASVVPNDNFSASEYGSSYNQIALCNGQKLHALGYKGDGMLIGIIDAGFFHADSLQALAHLFTDNKIIATRNFVDNQNVYLGATHGMMVLSSMAGILPGKLYGVAPNADFILMISENDTSEYPVEEDAWVAAIEFADSLGADVVNTSLGYTQFDDHSLDNTYANMDGKTIRASIAGGIASKKGIIVEVSAGNEGAHAWHYISAPSDAIDILCTGAVDSNGLVTGFSSRGPSADGRVKPDVCAMGASVVVADTKDGQTTRVAGTSLSGPLITGLSADLWQAFPDKSNNEIMSAIRMSGNHAMHPDADYGYGIPDYFLAYRILNNEAILNENEYLFQMYPNPFQDHPKFSMFSKKSQYLHASISDMAGRVIFENSYEIVAGNVLNFPLEFMDYYPKGMYLITLKSDEGIVTKKLVKE